MLNDVMLCHQAAYPSVEQPPPHHPPYYHHSHPPPPPHQAYHHHHHPPLPPHEAPPPRFRDKQRAPQHRAFTSSPVSVFQKSCPVSPHGTHECLLETNQLNFAECVFVWSYVTSSSSSPSCSMTMTCVWTTFCGGHRQW